ncbi:MAG: leucine-rich repeat domain-containing protein [Kineosporiaceae bacterium]
MGSPEVAAAIARAADERAPTLDLSGRGLTALPVSIGRLVELDALYLQGNALTALPDEVGELRGLSVLALSDNRLTELPPGIGRLCRLRGAGPGRQPARRAARGGRRRGLHDGPVTCSDTGRDR